jgi:steroid delta-isomerase-like uncharacterized protein
MADDQTRTLLDSYLTALSSRGDFARYFAPDVVWTVMETGDEIRGRDALRDFLVGFHTQVFDAHPEWSNVIIGEGTAVLEAVFDGTHIGDFAGIPPTGAHLRVPYCVVYDLSDGLITALRAYIPVTAMVTQLAGAGVGSP